MEALIYSVLSAANFTFNSSSREGSGHIFHECISVTYNNDTATTYFSTFDINKAPSFPTIQH